MALERERLISVFAQWGLEVTRPDAPATEGLVADRTAREVFTEIGIPERIGGHITLHDFSDGPATVADLLGNSDGSMRTVSDYIYLGSGDGILLLNGTTGEVFSWKDRSLSRISTALDSFVEFLVLIQEQLNLAERQGWPESGEEVRTASEHLMSAFRGIDGAAMAEASGYWRRFVRESFASMGFD
ncbi:SUKH-4 family immunity protein [Streptomyces sp. NPDC018031]|uniref:SUKH-4 family immunity protein n=1 Tax=Streptomyces sp. NPDC018031 TaxID=3365033 RepID=UPI003788E402